MNGVGFDEELMAKNDPDEAQIAQVREDWGEVVPEDPLEILEDPTIALELSEDPVRLYRVSKDYSIWATN